VTAATLAEMAVDAYTVGYAAVDAPDTLPLPDTAWWDLAAAVETVSGPGDYRLIFEQGALTAARTALHRARLRLYAKHRKLVVAAAHKALAGVNRKHLAGALVLLAGHPRTTRRDQALTTLRSAAYGLTGEPADWNQANGDAATDAATRGQAEGAASTKPGPPDPKKVTAGMAAAALAVGAVPAVGWVDRQLRRQAWQLSGVNPAQNPTAVDDNLDSLDGVGDQLEDDMHGTMSGAFASYFHTGPGTTLGLLDLVTEEDDKVCVDCEDLSEEGPYEPLTAMSLLPVHANCRCWLELA
jgi:hypothetical protein